MNTLTTVPTMPDGRPGYGPIPLMPTPSAVASEAIQTELGPGIVLTVYFANGQASFIFQVEEAKEVAERIIEQVKEVTTGLVIPKNKSNGLILP